MTGESLSAQQDARDCLAAHDLESAKFYMRVAKTAYSASDEIGKALIELVKKFDERFPDHPICDEFDVLPPWTGESIDATRRDCMYVAKSMWPNARG